MFPGYKYFALLIVLSSLLATIYLLGWDSQRGALILGIVVTFGTYLYYFNTINRNK